MRFNPREFLADIFFYGLGAGVLVLLGYLIYIEYASVNPEPKQHWNQGPQDPEGTH